MIPEIYAGTGTVPRWMDGIFGGQGMAWHSWRLIEMHAWISFNRPRPVIQDVFFLTYACMQMQCSSSLYLSSISSWLAMHASPILVFILFIYISFFAHHDPTHEFQTNKRLV